MRNKMICVFGGLAAAAFMSATIMAFAGQRQTFSISAFPPVATTRPSGPMAKYTVDLASNNGFSGKVLLICRTDSPGVTCSVLPRSVQLNPELAASATIVAGARGNVKSGSYKLVITGTTTNAGDRQSTSVTLFVR